MSARLLNIYPISLDCRGRIEYRSVHAFGAAHVEDAISYARSTGFDLVELRDVRTGESWFVDPHHPSFGGF